jgi:hypothetical protein
MSNEEILKVMKQAEGHLTAYKELLGPVVRELAEQKSLFVWGKKRGFEGRFGC